MKKFYSFILLFALCAFCAQAYTLEINYLGDSKYVTFKYVPTSGETQEFTPEPGQTYTFTMDDYNDCFYVTAAEACVTDEVEVSIYNNTYGQAEGSRYPYYNSYYGEYTYEWSVWGSSYSETKSYTVTAAAIPEYQTQIVIDDPTAATFNYSDSDEAITATNDFTLTYKGKYNRQLHIYPVSGLEFYKVVVYGVKDGAEVEYTLPSSYNYSTDKTYYYVNFDGTNYNYGVPTKIEIQVTPPAGAKCKVTFEYRDVNTYSSFTPSLDNPPFDFYADGVKIDLTDINSFEVDYGTNVTAKFQGNWAWGDAYYNYITNSSTWSYIYLTDGICDLGTITKDSSFYAYVKEVSTVEYVVNVVGVEHGKFQINFNDVTWVEGDNPVTGQTGDYLYFRAIDDETTGAKYEISSVLIDGVENQYSPSGSWYCYLADGTKKIEVVISEIIYDVHYVLYLDKSYTDLFTTDEYNAGAGGYCSFYYGGSYTYLTVLTGYNYFDTRAIEGALNISSYAYSSEYPVTTDLYINDVKSDAWTFTPANGDVVKMFLYRTAEEAPATYNVTFSATEKALEVLATYQVKKDHSVDVNVANGTEVGAVGSTEWTLTPIAAEYEAQAEGEPSVDPNFKVIVNGAEVAPVEGVYTFKTTAESTVEFTAQTDGIRNISLDNAIEGSDVYNLQGIRVATDGNLDTLPAGMYIVGGRKVVKR